MCQLHSRGGCQDPLITISTFIITEQYNNNVLKRSMGPMKEGKVVRSPGPGRHQRSSELNGKFAQYF